MNSFKRILCLLLCLNSVSNYAQEESNILKLKDPTDTIKIDKIELKKNWISWDIIIKNELMFEEGDIVTKGAIDTSIQKVWNIGNFAQVDYTIYGTENGNVLEIEAQDGVQFYPIITIDHSSEDDFKYEFGYGDENFLGSNSKLQIKWLKISTGIAWNFHLALPRQLLYKNMTATFGLYKGSDSKQFVEREMTSINGTKTAEYNYLMLAPYLKSEFYIRIGNPWHLDYDYRFSPDLDLTFMKHQIDHSLLNIENLALGVHVPEEQYNFLAIKISESIGTIDKKRHRLNGYSLETSYTWNIGLKGTSGFHSLSFKGSYHKTLNKFLQLSYWLKTGTTSADDHYKLIMGSGDVLGIRYGELYGKTTYSTYAGAHITLLNTKWISLENAYFVNAGNGADNYGELFTAGPLASVGTKFEIKFPVFPIAAFRFTFMYAGPGTEWFKFNM